MNHFQAIYRSTEVKMGVVHENKTAANKQVDLVNITYLTFNSIHAVIIVKLKTCNSQNNGIMPYKIDTGSDGNISAYHVFKFYF